MLTLVCKDGIQGSKRWCHAFIVPQFLSNERNLCVPHLTQSTFSQKELLELKALLTECHIKPKQASGDGTTLHLNSCWFMILRNSAGATTWSAFTRAITSCESVLLWFALLYIVWLVVCNNSGCSLFFFLTELWWISKKKCGIKDAMTLSAGDRTTDPPVGSTPHKTFYFLATF